MSLFTHKIMNIEKLNTSSVRTPFIVCNSIRSVKLGLCLIVLVSILNSCERTKIEYVNKDFHSSAAISTIAVFPIIQIAEKDNWCFLPAWLAGVDNRRTTSGPSQQIINEAHAMMMQNMAKLYKNVRFITPEVIDSILSSSPEKRTTQEAMNVLRDKIHTDAFVILKLNSYRRSEFNNKNGSVSCNVGSDDIDLSLFDEKAVLQWTVKTDCMLSCGKVKTYPAYIDYLFGRQLDWKVAKVNEGQR